MKFVFYPLSAALFCGLAGLAVVGDVGGRHNSSIALAVTLFCAGVGACIGAVVGGLAALIKRLSNREPLKSSTNNQ